jgi:ABC-2 type transport system ATP-binding protein
MEQSIFINVEQLSRYYGRQCAVNNVSFQVHRGEVLGFLGPNGAGKSTTMLMLTGNLAPTQGQIFINGIDILDNPKEAKAHIGFLPEQPPLYRELTVDEYLLYCARINRITKTKIPGAIAAAKQRCGLTEVGRRLIGNLSKGFQQRVGIAQAIIHSPAVVILDEPTVGLDPIQIREIRALIRELGGDHSVILSSHILPEIQSTCDRVQIINKGSLVLSESVSDLDRHIKVASFILALRRPPTVEILQRVESVNSVQSLASDRFRISHDAGANPAEKLAVLAVDNNWGLFELIPEKRTLEDIFLDITTAEQNDTQGNGAHEEQAA